MKHLSSISLVFLSLFASCSKIDNTSQSGKVNVRVQNSLTKQLDSVHISSANYGALLPNQVSNYKLIKEPIYTPYCQYLIDDSIPSAAGIGICGTPLPPPFKEGSYTFKIINSGNGFNEIIVTKD